MLCRRDTWTRIYAKPRRALFTPVLVVHGPRPKDLEKKSALDQSPDGFLDSTGQRRQVLHKRVMTIPSTSS